MGTGSLSASKCPAWPPGMPPSLPFQSQEPLPLLLPQAVLTPPVHVLARPPCHHTVCPIGDSLSPVPQEGRAMDSWPPREHVRVDTCSGDLWVARRRLAWLTAGVRRRSVPPPAGGWVRAGLGVGSGGQLDGALGTIPVSFLEEPLGGGQRPQLRGRLQVEWPKCGRVGCCLGASLVGAQQAGDPGDQGDAAGLAPWAVVGGRR